MEKIKTFVHYDVPSAIQEVKTFTRVYFWTAATLIFIVGLVYITQYVSGYHVEIVQTTISPIAER